MKLTYFTARYVRLILMLRVLLILWPDVVWSEKQQSLLIDSLMRNVRPRRPPSACTLV